MRTARASLKGSIRFNSVQSLLGFLHCHQNHQTLQSKLESNWQRTLHSDHSVIFSRLSFSSWQWVRFGLVSYEAAFCPSPCLAWPHDLSRLAPLRHSTSESVEEGYICHIAFFEAGAKFRAWQFRVAMSCLWLEWPGAGVAGPKCNQSAMMCVWTVFCMILYVCFSMHATAWT